MFSLRMDTNDCSDFTQNPVPSCRQACSCDGAPTPPHSDLRPNNMHILLDQENIMASLLQYLVIYYFKRLCKGTYEIFLPFKYK